MKVLRRAGPEDAGRKRRFELEARAASALNHPNIITIYDVDSAEGVDFIAMEYVPGRTLQQALGRKGMKLNDALRVGIQVADALAAAHRAGIVHRDLKPGNIMLGESGQVKVLDFGDEVATLEQAIPTETPVLAATPDGRRLLLVQADNFGSDLVLVGGFR